MGAVLGIGAGVTVRMNDVLVLSFPSLAVTVIVVVPVIPVCGVSTIVLFVLVPSINMLSLESRVLFEELAETERADAEVSLSLIENAMGAIVSPSVIVILLDVVRVGASLS